MISLIELGILTSVFAALPVIAGVFIAVLAGRAATSAATQSAPTTTATVVSTRVSVNRSCDSPCYTSRVKLTDLAQAAGDGTELVIHGQVTGDGTQPGATIAVKQDPKDPRHIEIPGYPNSPRERQWAWSSLAVILGLLGAGFDFLAVRRLAWTGRLGYRLHTFAGRRLYRRPRAPGQVTTARLARHYLLPAFGIPVLVAICFLLAALGAGATTVNDISTIDAVAAAPASS